MKKEFKVRIEEGDCYGTECLDITHEGAQEYLKSKESSQNYADGISAQIKGKLK